ncbi:MAG: hypothetical protein HY259_08940 [Chloroflexi bacterium]|nr:hypothetical protein [Chloroflexota bacterium]
MWEWGGDVQRPAAGGRSWCFLHTIENGALWFDNYIERANATSATTYVGTHYELSGGTASKYYFAAGRRVALQNGSGVYYLHGDHLGSTSLMSTRFGA